MGDDRADGRPRRPRGHRLSDETDPAVKAALRVPCPTCRAEPGRWCVGVSGTKMRGRRLTRIHMCRCAFHEAL